MANGTQPLEPPPLEPPAVFEFNERIKSILAFAFLSMMGLVIAVWTFHAPQLPGETVGIIVGGFMTTLGNMAGYYWSGTAQKKA